MKSSLTTVLVRIFLLAPCLLTAPVWAATTVLLNANFNDKSLDTSIGTGGPSVGEPSFVHPLIEATVQASPMRTPSLQISNKTGARHGNVVFDFPASEGVFDGELRVAFTLRAPNSASDFLFRLGNQASACYLVALALAADGNISASDARGTSGTVRNWSPGETLAIEYLHHLDSRTYDLRINSTLHLGNRPYGVVAPRECMGQIVFATDQNIPWVVDDVVVTQTHVALLKKNPVDLLDVPVGSGGVRIGEPVSTGTGEAELQAGHSAIASCLGTDLVFHKIVGWPTDPTGPGNVRASANRELHRHAKEGHIGTGGPYVRAAASIFSGWNAIPRTGLGRQCSPCPTSLMLWAHLLCLQLHL